MTVIKAGQYLTLRTTQGIDDDGEFTLTDPTALVLALTKPDGTNGPTFSIAGGTLTRISTGVYEARFTVTDVGPWRYSWTATGAVVSYSEGEFEVEALLEVSAGYRTLAQLVQDVRDELGPLNSTNYTDVQIGRYINDGQARINAFRNDSMRVSWEDDAGGFELPADCRQVHHLRAISGGEAYEYEVQGSTLWFRDGSMRAGTARMDFQARYPRITATQPCALPEPGPSGVVAYGAYRVLKRIAAYRADFKLYATQQQTNDVSSEDIERLADLHLREFEEVRDQLEVDVDVAVGY